MCMSDEHRQPTIHAKHEASGLTSIHFLNCKLTFNGSELNISNVNIRFIGLSHNEFYGFFGMSHVGSKINLAKGDSSFSITIQNCDIENTHQGLDLDFRGKSLCLRNCTNPVGAVSDTFSFVWTKNTTKHTISGLKDGWFILDSDGLIIAQNVSVYFSDKNINVDTTKNYKAEWLVQSVGSIRVVSGEIKLLEMSGSPCTIEVEKGSSVSQLNMQHMGVFYGIQSNSDSCKIERTGTHASDLKLYSLNHIKAIDIYQRIESFLCDTCDFSETRIRFSENASLLFKQLESTATLWNPNWITYRGFCPSRFKETKKINGIPAARQFFCEMKTFFSNKGDSITAGEFHAAEMIAQRRYLQISRKEKGKGLVGYLSLYTDLFVMFLSHHSSTFGQNLFRAISSYLLLGFIFSLLFFCLGNLCPYCYQGEYFWSNFDCSFFGLFFLHVLSPLNLKLDDIGLRLISSWWLTFFWMLWKIIGSFLIFQIIASSRRFIRKW